MPTQFAKVFGVLQVSIPPRMLGDSFLGGKCLHPMRLIRRGLGRTHRFEVTPSEGITGGQEPKTRSNNLIFAAIDQAHVGPVGAV